MENIIKKVKEKPELNNLPDSLVENAINEYLKKNRLQIPKSEKEIKLVVKEIRAELRKYAGQYASKENIKKREELLSENNFDDLLKQHSSTRERLGDYDFVKSIISEINPKTILDLGCGINPIAISKKGIKYHCYDINENDLKIVREFFAKNDIDGDTHHLDIRNIEVYPKVDLCIIFKVLDILGNNRNEISQSLIKNIDSKFFLVSFATRTLSGKKMNSPYRRWFEKILKNLKLNYEIKRTNQELFYIIKK